jgi:glycosyltransferase involved in cell wall biosynthesis
VTNELHSGERGESAAVILPALNEEECIGKVLDELRAFPLVEAIVVDNGSTDRTAEFARMHGASVIHEPRRGYGQACLAGIAALRDSTEFVVFMDADGSADPAELPNLLSILRSGEADLVLGSRVLGTREPGALPPHQAWGNKLAVLLLRLFHGVRCTDLGPFRAIRRDALAKLDMRDTNFGWTIEMQIKANRRGLRVVETPVSSRRRRKGRSKISGTLRGTVLAGSKILWSVLKYR